jgi:glycosyltransferase 2 family protein
MKKHVRSNSRSKLLPQRRHLLLLLVLVLAIYIVLPQFGSFRASWHLLRHPRPSFTATAVGFTTLTYLASTTTYCLLAFRPLRFARTLLVQLAAMFINRLLPAGVGALGVNYIYLKRERHSSAQATSLVAVNNLLGFVGHGLLLLGTVLFFSDHAKLSITKPSYIVGLVVAMLAVAILVLVLLSWLVSRQRRSSTNSLFSRLSHSLQRTIQTTKQQLLAYRRRLNRVAAALLSSMTLTVCNTLCLLCCAEAFAIHLPFAALLLILSFGVGAGLATPTPGGLGGFEAGLTAGLVAYHVPASTALAAALLYRLLSYWLPLVFGALAFAFCQRRGLLTFKD